MKDGRLVPRCGFYPGHAGGVGIAKWCLPHGRVTGGPHQFGDLRFALSGAGDHRR
jgi:hypothetical protein